MRRCTLADGVSWSSPRFGVAPQTKRNLLTSGPCLKNYIVLLDYRIEVSLGSHGESAGILLVTRHLMCPATFE